MASTNDRRRRSGRPGVVRPKGAVIAAGWLIAGLAACSYDFEAFDPRIASPTGTGATGAGGGNTGGGTGGATACEPNEEVPCYTGPEGTEDVGTCHGGTARCNSAGTGFGACEGEVTPLPEDCNTIEDDDCDGVANEPDALCQCEPGEANACYEGPVDTMDRGACHAGQQICDSTGTAYGVCYGQMLPRHESCETEVDDDCDDVANDHCAIWSRRYGGNTTDIAWSAAVDSDGNVIVVGELRNTVTIGATQHPGDSSGDAFVVKLDASGNPIWSKRYGGAGGFDGAYDVTVDDAGAIYVTGVYTASIDFGGGYAFTGAGGNDLFVLKLDSAGNTVWAQGYGDLQAQSGWAIAYGGGRVVVTGPFSGSFTLGSTDLAATAEGTEDGYAASFDATTGTLEWAIRFGGAGADQSVDVVVDGTGVSYVVGHFSNSVDFGGATIQHVSGIDGFIAKLDTDGSELWSMGIGAAGEQDVEAVSLHPSGGIVVAGEQDGTLALGGEQWASLGYDDTWVARVTADGTVSWGASFGGEFDEDVDAVRVDAEGNIYVAGATAGAVDYGDGPLVIAGQDDWVLLALDSAGAIRYTRHFASAEDEDMRGLALDPAGRPVIVGSCAGPMDLGTGPLASYGGADACIGKIEP